MGGYDFPGSNAASDIFALTAWIPEHILLHSDSIDLIALWNRLFAAWRFRDILITIGTGLLTAEESELFGLVSEHDYAVIDMRVLESGQRVVLIKNPWNLENLPQSSQSRFMSAESLPQVENCCWMEFSRMSVRFNSLYLNWNPLLFKYKKQAHFEWNLENGKGFGSLRKFLIIKCKS